MKFTLRLRAVKWRLFAGALVVLLAGYVSSQYWRQIDVPSPPPRALSQAEVDSPSRGADLKTEGSGASSPRSGMKVYINPKTGQFENPPVGQLPSGAQTLPPPHGDEEESRAVKKGLEEQASPVMGGGMVTDVHGRFRRPLVATRDENGRLAIQHMPQEADLTGEQ